MRRGKIAININYFLSIVISLIVSSSHLYGQGGQLSINRVSQMPSLPSPYLMRDWKTVAINYDQLAFSTTITGEHLPLIGSISTGINYPELAPILLQTYVGSNSGNQAEAINIIPAIVGASLMGLDKSNQDGVNWVIKTKDFFNKTNGQNVYLNGYSTSSGGDWWYDVMPNIFFYQLFTQYPDISDYDQQFTSVADRWLDAVHSMGGSNTPWTVPNMNYRAWDLSTMTGNSDGVIEPEASGGIGWLLYHAYVTTGEKKYLEGAQMSIEFLSNLDSNPSYELQLPYGTLTAAKMNADLGTTYDISKMINWSFDRGALRGWGTIAGTWNGLDVDGLIGEANDGGNDYAFIMNGFQQVAALVPMIKYDKRFARGIAKWTLNMANASRLFYSQYLPEDSQDDFIWSSANDPNSVIAYEALKEVWEGKPLYGTGDAKRNSWTQTNLGLYGSSHVGYLAAIVEPTDVEGILLLDLNKTDFFKTEVFPSYAVYNPHPTDQQVTLPLSTGSYDIYDAISETIINTNVNGSVLITIKADETLLLTYVPSGSVLSPIDGKLYIDEEIVDYHYGYDFGGSLRIKSLAASDTLVEFNQQVPVFALVENETTTVNYTWSVNGVTTDVFTDNVFTWTVPSIAGRTVLQLNIESDGKTALDSIVFNVVEDIPVPPVIHSITADKLWYMNENQAVLMCDATDDNQTPGELTYNWTVPAGTIINENGVTLTWQLPNAEGVYEVECEVTDLELQTTTAKKLILTKQLITEATPPFAYYPLDGDANDYSGNGRHAMMSGVDDVADARGEPNKAYQFDSGSDIIYVDNSSTLNFQDKITLSFWVKLSNLSDEAFILSHGSWEERWKVSVIPDGRLRWTVKTNAGTIDLDSTFPLELNQFYHFAVVYTGYSMELYVDGELDNFITHSGLMGTTSKSLTFGRKDEGESKYFLRGTLDEVRIYNASLLPDDISTLISTWNLITGVEGTHEIITIYPNPSNSTFYISGIADNQTNFMSIHDLNGRSVNFDVTSSNDKLKINVGNERSGLLLLKIKTDHSIYFHKIFIN
jgi:hypothetical protein